MNQTETEDLRRAVRFFYDLQKLRIGTGNRAGSDTADLEDGDQGYLAKSSTSLHDLEKGVLKEISKLLKGVPIYEEFLRGVKGVGPTMAGVIVSEIDVHRAPTASALWAYCGLAVDTTTGKAVRRQKGKKSNWNPFVKTKMVGVLADCLMRANSDPWRGFYYTKKHQYESMRLDCTACDNGEGATGKMKKLDSDGKPIIKKGSLVLVTCTNCSGTLKGPWGNSKAHRHNAAKRYMVKMFLLELHKVWRELEGLKVRPPYAEEKLGIKHHDNGTSAHP